MARDDKMEPNARMTRPYRIGAGAGFSADRLDPAVDLARRGALDAMIIECLGERTLAFAHRDRAADPARGYNAWLERRMRALLPPCRDAGTVIVTNMGAANPLAAAERTVAIARELGLAGLEVACVEGDEVSSLLDPDTPFMDEPGRLRDVDLPVVGANAYLGADAILPALEAGADIVIGGRIADPSLAVAPLAHHFGWRLDDWPRLGAGTLVGHLLECGMQVTGGYFADPGVKDVPDLARCGFPIAEVGPDGAAIITKLADTGGCVTPATVKEQLLYEVHDPRAYLTPDVTADFSGAQVAAAAPDRVAVAGASGRRRPDRLKVTVGFEGGFLAEAGVSYAGANAQGRARLAGEIVETRMREVHGFQGAIRADLVGVASLFATAGARAADAEDVRLHMALRARRREDAELLLWEVESLLCCGPAGGGGFRGAIVPSVVTKSVLVERERVRPSVRILVA
jgi:hypothetical protein